MVSAIRAKRDQLANPMLMYVATWMKIVFLIIGTVVHGL